jgi:FkbM family methyltransferase
MAIAQVLKGVANRFGYDIRRLRAGPIRTTVAQTYEHLKSLGFQPATVIDVGVAYGTSDLWAAFPDAFFVLVEPLREFEPAMQEALRRLKGTYILAAAGPTNGEVTFNAHDDYLVGSSLLKEGMGPEVDGHEITVPMVRLDDCAKVSGPILLKVDVQGAELGVLDGAPNVLRETEVVVLEASLFRFMKDQPDFHDIIVAMKQRGFVVYDILPAMNRPLDKALGQVDLVFVKERGRFRQSHAFSTVPPWLVGKH